MRLILAPQIVVRIDGPQVVTAQDLSKYPTVEVSDDVETSLALAISDAIRTNAEAVVGADPTVDAPRYEPDVWWVAAIVRSGDPTELVSFGPSYFYGLDGAGRLHLRHLPELSVADFVRAVDAGHYPTTEHTLVVTRAGEFGGNGAIIPDLVTWILREVPWVFLGWQLSRADLRRDQKKREELELLASDWAARKITHPYHLRVFIQTRDRWYPSVLAQRLAVSEEVASRLLQALGYESCDDGALEFRGTTKGQSALDAWQDGERREGGYASLDELLEAEEDQRTVDRSANADTSQEDAGHCESLPARRSLWGRVGQVIRRVRGRNL